MLRQPSACHPTPRGEGCSSTAIPGPEQVRPSDWLSETDAVALGTHLLRDNVREVFKV